MVRLGWWVFGRGSAIPMTLHDLSPLKLTLIVWLRWWWPGLSTAQLFCLPSLSMLYFWKEVTVRSPHLRSGSYGPPPWRQSRHYLEFFCMGDLSLPPFVHIIYFFDFYFILYFRLQPSTTLFCYSNYFSVATGSSFYVFLTYTHHCIFIVCVLSTCLLLSYGTNSPGSSYEFPAPVQESAISPRSPSSFYWEAVRNQDLGK